MNIILWIMQGLLALVFGGAGAFKLIQPKDKIAAQLAWAKDFTPNTIKLIGGIEVLGALGLILPWLTGIAPILTPLAAMGLALTMFVAGLVHARLKEYPMVGINIVLLSLALFVAYGRF